MSRSPVWPTPSAPAHRRVIEVLGDPDDFGVDVEMMIRKHQLPRIFPERVLGRGAQRPLILDQEEAARRADFRGLPIVTIDGETARDFDDAVMVTERADGSYEPTGAYCRRGRVRAPRYASRSRGAAPRHQRLLP